MTRTKVGRRLTAAFVLATLASWVAPTLPGATAVSAADNGNLRLSVATTYRVDPAGARVRVRMDVTATNLKPDSARFFYYYDRLFFSIQPEARSVRATSGGKKLTVSIAKHRRYRELTVRIPQLRYRKTRTVRIEFDLPGGAPRSSSDIRVGQAFTSFYAWAWGDPRRSSVRVVLPAGFEVDASGSTYRESVDDGHPILSEQAIADPIDWYLVVNADRPSKLTDDALVLPHGRLLIHAWPEDRAWLALVRELLGPAVPDLETRIGLPWPVVDELEINEIHTPLLEGYAGFYDDAKDAITISEDLDEQTMVHEASHAWFDRTLVDVRWAFEGLADEYASRVLASLGRQPESPDAVTRDAPAAFALNLWPAPAAIADDSAEAKETYGYNASWKVMRAIVSDVGEERMRDVLRAASDWTMPYTGEVAAESAGSLTGWRRFLDLLEEVGGSTEAEALFREWVLLPGEASMLEPRAAARTAYRSLETDAGSWAVPFAVRRTMTAWDFPEARELMVSAESALDARDRLRDAEATLQITSPQDLEGKFEAADNAGKLVVVQEELGARQAAADQLATATRTVGGPTTWSPIVTLGLLGEEPLAGLGEARSAYTAGDLAGVASGTSASLAILAGAEPAGQARAFGIGVAVSLVLLIVVLLVVRRLRRRRRRVAAAGPYATLAATSEPESPADGHEPRERGADPD